MSGFENAFKRASSGLDWSYPCLVWVADYVRDETGRDPAAVWRCIFWTERSARRELVVLSEGGRGGTLVERAVDSVARKLGWEESDSPLQGEAMVGIYTSENGEGVPAVFDGQKRWLLAGMGDATVTTRTPDRMWVLPR